MMTVRLYPPLRFPDGRDSRRMETGNCVTTGSLLQRLDDEGVFSDFGRNALLVMTDDRVCQEDDVIADERLVKIILHAAGG